MFVHCGVLTVGVRKKLGLPSPFDLRLGDPLALAAIAPRVSHGAGDRAALRRRHAARGADGGRAVPQHPPRHVELERLDEVLSRPDARAVFRQALAVVGPGRLLFGTDSSFFPRGWQQPVYDGAGRRARRDRRVATTRSGEDLRRELRSAVSVPSATPDAQRPAKERHVNRTFRDLIVLAVSRHRPALRLAAVARRAQPTAAQPADLVLTNGKVVTVEDAAAGGAGDRRPRRSDRRARQQRRHQALRRAGHPGHRLQGQLVDSRASSRGTVTSPASARRSCNLKLMTTTSWDEIVAMVGDGGEDGEARRVDHTAAAGTRRSGRRGRPERRGVSRRTPRSTRCRRTIRCC